MEEEIDKILYDYMIEYLDGDALKAGDYAKAALLSLYNKGIREARKQAANDIFNLAHEYAINDKTMKGSEELRSSHYFNAINKIGEFDGR